MARSITKLLLATTVTATLLSACASSPAEAHRVHAVGVSVNVLPVGHRTVVVGKKRYFVHNGVYYRGQGRNFRVVAAPVGLRVATLPAGFVAVNLNGTRYYRHGNTYYRSGQKGFVVVKRPRGARVVVG
ncbi:MAG: hypothetical protein JJ850_14325 [Kordiimonadaceae bacterium]|nr:hypothetical protein [Kordiimonadaceae bacterium]MBO6570109.1 hypothetical protein [Kordiimonadaceae bacterium]MBO6965793.1 hypothetical protein [Kordiimonadaceae bacterium]